MSELADQKTNEKVGVVVKAQNMPPSGRQHSKFIYRLVANETNSLDMCIS
jgi:hypothetical protein